MASCREGHDLEMICINAKGQVYRNLDVDTLIEKSIALKEGIKSRTGALTVNTGKYTGRSPNDKFIVDTSSVHRLINWGKVNRPISEANYKRLYKKVAEYLSCREEIFIFDGMVGADPDYTLHMRVINELAYQNLFATQLLRRPTQEELKDYVPKFTVIAAPGCYADPKEDGTSSEAFIVTNFDENVVLIGGSMYAGEIKKSIFSVMNYFLPLKGVLPMHCSANIGKSGDVALFFGLSGTGKTSLSADPDRRLIGDDEHGWSKNGIFNFEGGCYAKCINLSKEKEPHIFNAIKHGAIVENVVMHPETKEYDFNDASITENTRAGYPIDFIPNAELSGVAGHPKTIIFLTADAFGVMPPISRLTKEQAMYHFMSGYTSKLAGTERGIIEPQATFSACFGEPFMPLEIRVYAELLEKYIAQYDVKVFLINTGWTGGPYGTGKRIDINYTRKMVSATLSGELDNAKCKLHPIFNLAMITSVPNVPNELLNPESTWEDKTAYEKKAEELAKLFIGNFTKFNQELLANEGPRLN